MEAVIVMGILFALLLGTGAAKESKARYGFGFWGVLAMAIASFFVMTVLKAILFILGLIVLAFLTWIVGHSMRFGRAIEGDKK